MVNLVLVPIDRPPAIGEGGFTSPLGIL